MADSIEKQVIAAFQTMLQGISKANGYNFDVAEVQRKKVIFDGRIPDNLSVSQDLHLYVFSELQTQRIAGMNTGSSQKPRMDVTMLINIQGLTNGVYPNEGDAGLDVQQDIIERVRAQIVSDPTLGVARLSINAEDGLESTILYPLPGTSDLTAGAQVIIGVRFRRN